MEFRLNTVGRRVSFFPHCACAVDVSLLACITEKLVACILCTVQTTSDRHHHFQVGYKLPCLCSCLGCTKYCLPEPYLRTADCPIWMVLPADDLPWPNTSPWLPERGSRRQLRGSLAAVCSNTVTGNSFLNTTICPSPNPQRKVLFLAKSHKPSCLRSGLQVDVCLNTSCTRFACSFS